MNTVPNYCTKQQLMTLMQRHQLKVKTQRVGVKVQFQPMLNWHQMETELHGPAALLPGKELPVPSEEEVRCTTLPHYALQHLNIAKWDKNVKSWFGKHLEAGGRCKPAIPETILL
jgi:hypothetical protein